MPTAARCQGTTATLNGTAQDTTGAVIVNAKIEAKNEATGDTRRTISNETGFFAFSGLPSGDYDILVESAGFNSIRKNGIHLDPGDTRTVREIKLTIGAASTSVTVSAVGQSLEGATRARAIKNRYLELLLGEDALLFVPVLSHEAHS